MDNAKKQIESEISNIQKEITQNKALLQDVAEADSSNETQEIKALATEELEKLQTQLKNLQSSLAALNGDYESNEDDSDPTSVINKNIAILEIRAGTGGEEASLFANDLYNMYLGFAQKMQWGATKLFKSDSERGGIKTVSLEIKGQDAFTLLKNEAGVHRVQRIPVTESSGRIHTSAATVSVLPKLKKVEIEIKPDDLKWDFFRSGGAGGQNVNKVSTAVRLTHLPSEIVIECQQERKQGKNREKALEMLKSRLFSIMQEQKLQKIDDIRSNHVGGGDRSEKIRTYNFPQDRITDHRVKKSWHNIEAVFKGNLDKIVEETKGL